MQSVRGQSTCNIHIDRNIQFIHESAAHSISNIRIYSFSILTNEWLKLRLAMLITDSVDYYHFNVCQFDRVL